MDKQTIIDRMEARATNLGFCAKRPSVTVIAHPGVFPIRCIMTPPDIYNFFSKKAHIRRVAGGVCWAWIAPENPDKDPLCNDLTEFNEFGIAFRKDELRCYGDEDNEIDCDRIAYVIDELLGNASQFYKKCGYSGEIAVSVALEQVFGKRITEAARRGLIGRGELPPCLDSDVSVNNVVYYVNDIDEGNNRKEIATNLLCHLLWSFGVNTNDEKIKDNVKARI